MPRTKKIRPKPMALVLLEGWGIAPANEGNAIAAAQTPYIDKLVSRYPAATLTASGAAIGLPEGEGGSSRVGHVVIGTGNYWQNTWSAVDKALEQKDFCSADIFKKITERLENGAGFHLVGLVSSADSEASFEQLKKLLNCLAQHNFKNPLLHCVLDGKESASTSGQRLVADLEKELAELSFGRIASLIGRFYAMDEKHNEARTDKAVDLLVKGEGKEAVSAEEAIADSYDKKIFDEEFAPSYIGADTRLADGDVIFFWNHFGKAFRTLLEKLQAALPNSLFISLTPYGIPGLEFVVPVKIAEVSIGRSFAAKNFRQLRLGDSAAFSGVSSWLDGATDIHTKIERRLVPTSAELSVVDAALEDIKQIKREFSEAVQHGNYDFIAVAFSQPDTVAHSASFEELVSVIEKLDDALRVMMENIENTGGVAMIVGTHGVAERLIDPVTGTRSKEHSLNPVPLYIVGTKYEGFNLGWPEAVGGDLSVLKPIGSLIDVAPTFLGLADMKIPDEFRGKNLAA